VLSSSWNAGRQHRPESAAHRGDDPTHVVVERARSALLAVKVRRRGPSHPSATTPSTATAPSACSPGSADDGTSERSGHDGSTPDRSTNATAQPRTRHEASKQRPRTPTRMRPRQRHDTRLNHHVDLMRATIRPATLIRQRAQTAVRITDKPPMHALAAHAITTRHVGDRRPRVEHLTNSQITLLNHRELHQHDRHLHHPGTPKSRPHRGPNRWNRYNTRTEPASPTNRSRAEPRNTGPEANA